MAALNPEIIKDGYHLIALYQRNPAFRERFDLAVKRNVNVTYKNRPIKLYFEILASSNQGKFGDAYKQISRLVKHDEEGIIKKTMMRVTTRDFVDLNLHARKAEKDENTTTYPETEIEKINNIEKTAKNSTEKIKKHTERLTTTEYLAVPKKTAVPKEEKEEKTGPGSSPEQKKSYSPATEEEKARLEAALNQPRKEVPKNILVSPRGEPLFQEQPSQPTEPAREGAGPSLPQPPSLGFAKKIFRAGKKVETAGVEAGTRLAAEKAVARGVGGLISKGVSSTVGSALVKTSSSLLLKLGFSAATGIATGGIGLAVGLVITVVTTFGDEAKKLGKLLFQVTVAIICAFLLLFVWNWGERMNSLLPPYSVGEAAGLPTTAPTATPSGTITPTPSTPTPSVPRNASSCPIPGGRVTCGSYFTPVNGCGHCGEGYLPEYRAAYCSPMYGGNASYTGTESGLDIGGVDNQAIYLPMINGQIINWTFAYEVGTGEAIQRYNGSSLDGQHSYVLQLHHTQAGSGNRSATKSGDLGGRICTTNSRGELCKEYHVHVQLETLGAWVDAAQYFCR